MKKQFLTAALVAFVAVIGLMLSSPVGAPPLDMDSPGSGSVNNPKEDI